MHSVGSKYTSNVFVTRARPWTALQQLTRLPSPAAGFQTKGREKGKKTRITFCGMWYLPHSQVHNERTVPIIMAGSITRALNGNISTSALKSDSTTVRVPRLRFPTRRENFGNSAINKGYIA